MLYTIGIDEVGRGALAGPVAVAAVALPKSWKATGLKDSKRLTPKARDKWFLYAKSNPHIFYAVARVYPNKIDQINIAEAANLSATHALIRLLKYPILTKQVNVFLDGSLYLKKVRLADEGFHLKCRTVTGGDERINAIKLASVVAKVARDKYMIKLHHSYPHYGFDAHKGYGTERHRRAIKKHGLSKVHRRSFKIK